MKEDNSEKNAIKFHPFKIFTIKDQSYLFDGSSISIYKIDNTALKILECQSKTVKEIRDIVCTEIDEQMFWDTFNKMVKSGFIVKEEILSPENEIPCIKGVTLMLVQACNLACQYCFGSEGEYADRGKMHENVAIDTINYLIENSGDAKELYITFFGGEPLLCFDLIKKIIGYCKDKEKTSGKKFIYNMTTNGTLLNDEINEFIIQNKIGTMISIDGNRDQQNAKRYYKNGAGCYDEVIEKTQFLREKDCLSARATITASNIELKEVFEHLYSLGFRSIPMAPAFNLFTEPEYNLYFTELKKLCDYFGELLKKDIGKAKTIRILWKALKRIHTGAKQYTACGAGINGVAVDIHGNMYPCHRYVSNKEYILGNIYDNIDKRKQFADEVRVDNFEECKNCYLRLLCGGGCSYENYVEMGSTQKIFEKQCLETKTIYTNMIPIYLSLNDEEKKSIFDS